MQLWNNGMYQRRKVSVDTNPSTVLESSLSMLSFTGQRVWQPASCGGAHGGSTGDSWGPDAALPPCPAAKPKQGRKLNVTVELYERSLASMIIFS